jgi:hypothetical protein
VRFQYSSEGRCNMDYMRLASGTTQKNVANLVRLVTVGEQSMAEFFFMAAESLF